MPMFGIDATAICFLFNFKHNSSRSIKLEYKFDAASFKSLFFDKFFPKTSFGSFPKPKKTSFFFALVAFNLIVAVGE